MIPGRPDPLAGQAPFDVFRDAELAKMGGLPVLTDVPCPHCGAGLGEVCRSPRAVNRERGHAARIDVHLRQLRRVRFEAVCAAEVLFDKAARINNRPASKS